MVSIFFGAVVGVVVAPVAPVVPGAVVAVCAWSEPPPSLQATASSASAVATTTNLRAHDRSGLSSQLRIRGRFEDNTNLVEGRPGNP
jgi:hypothetical protein